MTTLNDHPVIQLDNVHKIYDSSDVRVHAMRGVSLSVEGAEFVAIMGASGSGKSTMMNILGCLDRPTKGAYRLAGIDVSQLGKDERADIRNKKLGFVFQGFNLLRRTSALENVELPLIYAGVPAEERIRRSKRALAAVGLGHKEQSLPNQLSGGQQQRVAIARALVNRPALLLADEPTGNLDSRTSIEIMALFQKLNRDHGITIVLVTHEPDIAQYAKRMVVMKDGQIILDRAVRQRRDAEVELAATVNQVESEEVNAS
jgi:putative ABC transport system ATP-binding protein